MSSPPDDSFTRSPSRTASARCCSRSRMGSFSPRGSSPDSDWLACLRGASCRMREEPAPRRPPTPWVRRSIAGRPSTARPQLARATAWMESGFQQSVVSNVGAIGVMQLLPGTWAWVDQMLLGTTTPRTYDWNIRAGVRYLRWLLDQFNGDRRLALAGAMTRAPRQSAIAVCSRTASATWRSPPSCTAPSRLRTPLSRAEPAAA